jgi:hypothetical protein
VLLDSIPVQLDERRRFHRRERLQRLAEDARQHLAAEQRVRFRCSGERFGGGHAGHRHRVPSERQQEADVHAVGMVLVPERLRDVAADALDLGRAGCVADDLLERLQEPLARRLVLG